MARPHQGRAVVLALADRLHPLFPKLRVNCTHLAARLEERNPTRAKDSDDSNDFAVLLAIVLPRTANTWRRKPHFSPSLFGCFCPPKASR